MRREDNIVALDLLIKVATAEKKRLTAEWLDDARPKQADPAMIGDKLLGVVRIAKGRETMKLRDPKALLDWCLEHAPHLVSYEPHISDANLAVLKRNPVDSKTGELLPGFEPEFGEPYATVRLEDGALELFQAELAKGAIPFSEVLELGQ